MSDPVGSRQGPGLPVPGFVGRERERVLLREHLDAALAGRGGLVLVGGEAGIGKTTLVEDLAARAEEMGALVLWGHSYDLSVTPPYGPWLEILRRYRGSAADPALPSVPAVVRDAEALARVGSQETLFATVAGFFAAVAARQPLLLVLDDLHWADQASLDLLRVLARSLGDYRLGVVAIYRVDEVTRDHPLYRLVPLLVREARGVRVDLRPLDLAATRTLVTRRYALPPSDLERLDAYLQARAEGNPLYLGELLRTLEDERVLVDDGGDWHLGDLEHLPVPPLLAQVIEGRLARLSDTARGLLEVAAVIGHRVPLDLWQRVSEADEATLAEAVEAGSAGHLLVEGAGGAVEFSHALLREALYQRIVLVRRRYWHRQVGDALAGSPHPDPDAVAHHFAQAGDARATEWLLKAGERAQRAYAWVTAVARFEAALARLTDQGAPASERAVLLWRIAYLLRYGDTRRALVLMEEARRLAIVAGEVGLASYCLSLVGIFQNSLGDSRTGLDTEEEAVATYRALSSSEQARCRVLLGLDIADLEGTLVVGLANVGRLEEARERGLRMVADTPMPELHPGQVDSGYGHGLFGLAEAEALLGQPGQARRRLRQALTVVQTIEDHAMAAQICTSGLELIYLPYYTDSLEERRHLAEESTRAGRRAQGSRFDAPDTVFALPLLLVEGNWAIGHEVAVRAFDSASRTVRLVTGERLALLAHLRGDDDLARQVIVSLLPDGPATQPGNMFIWPALPLQRLAAGLALDDGDLPTARAWLEAHDRWLAWSGAVLGRAESALGWAAFHHVRGEHSHARRHAEQALAHASQPRQPLALIAAHRLLGTLDTERRRFDSAEDHLHESLVLADACAAPFERALTLLDLAELRVAAHRPGDARALLAEVRSICEPLGARPTLARVAALETALDADPSARRARVPRPGGLTAREVEVLRLVAEGLSDAEVADRLFLSTRTVSTHLTSTYTKLGVNSRAAATRFAVQHGIA